MRQRPHATLNGTVTRSPFSRNTTSDPFSTISPVISWPSTMPVGAVVRPRTMCWSEPQMLDAITFKMTPWSIALPRGSSSLGSGIGSTSTLFRPRNTTPSFAMAALLECGRARRGDGLVLFARSAAHADGADDLTTTHERDPAREDHDADVIRGVDPVELLSGLRLHREILRGEVERASGVRLVDRDLDRSEPGSVHAYMRDQVAAAVDDRDVHRLPHLRCLLLGGRDHAARLLQLHHHELLRSPWKLGTCASARNAQVTSRCEPLESSEATSAPAADSSCGGSRTSVCRSRGSPRRSSRSRTRSAACAR